MFGKTIQNMKANFIRIKYKAQEKFTIVVETIIRENLSRVKSQEKVYIYTGIKIN